MTQDKINVAELLKDCPSGMELDCTCADNVVFDKIIEYEQIKCVIGDCHDPLILDKYGRLLYICCPKCVIFPKGKTTWEGFQRPFKDGDIIATDLGSVFILKSCLEDKTYYHSYIGVTCCNEFKEKQMVFAYKYVCQLATEEEQAKLFQAIKDNGYKWNAETKTLEKLINKNKFVVGTTITNGKIISKIVSKDVDSYQLEDGNYVFFNEVHNWELVHNKFDINTLKPFDKVLVRNDREQYWIPAFWGFKRADGYVTTFGWCKYCIPFEGNEHLLETNKDCDEYFKTWG